MTWMNLSSDSFLFQNRPYRHSQSPVSCVRNCLFIHTKKKNPEQMENECLLKSIRELRSQGKLLPPKLQRHTVGYRETLVIRVDAQKQKTLQQPLPVSFYLALTSGFQKDPIRSCPQFKIGSVGSGCSTLMNMAQTFLHSFTQSKLTSAHWVKDWYQP